ncbi:MAG: RDD family protein [Actinomycetota bacterium]|nr:RDD family protein [Actinomycetota bacterium]
MADYRSPTSAGGPSGPRAGFGARLAAFLVDVLLVSVVTAPLTFLFGRLLGQVVSTLLGLAYWAYLEGSPSGQTLGKRAMNIRVVDFSNGEPIDVGRALIRYLGRIVSGIPCALGYLWSLWDKEKQTWHDKIAGTVVVPTSAYPVSAWPG